MSLSSQRRLSWFVASAAVAAYLPSIWAGFVHDDQQLIVNNPAAHGLEHAGACFGAYFGTCLKVRSRSVTTGRWFVRLTP